MKIHNVRLGMATNSSSTHSVILMPSISAFKGEVQGGEFGWEDFLLTSREDKEQYLGSTLWSNMVRYGGGLSPEYAAIVVNSLVGREVIRRDKDGEYNYYVDHQSLIDLPVQYGGAPYGRSLDLEFFEEFKRHLLDTPGLAIAGGNDNQAAHEKVRYGGVKDKAVSRLRKVGDQNMVARKDGEHWVLFNQRTGAKVRLSFTSDEPYEAATRPELVDYRLTDWCAFGCSFCYANSTKQGKHSTCWHQVLRTLADMRVFEVAFGGGETTMHPEFAEVLRTAKQHGIVPNFTTFNLNWAKNEKINNAVVDCAGGFAVSVNEIGQRKVVDAANWQEEHARSGNPEVSIQCILGVADTDTVVGIMGEMKEAGLSRLTLLGYKSFGRAEHLPQPKKVNLPAIFKAAKKNYIQLGMDTKAVADYTAELDGEKVPKTLRTTREGVFSMYVDGVKMFVAKDSYSREQYPFDVKVTYSPDFKSSEHGPLHIENVIASRFPFAE